MTTQEAKNAINNYILGNGGEYSKWYVGITSNPEERLFSEHNVTKNNSAWIYCPCLSSISARNVESYFLKERRALGGGGGGDDDSIYVYAYKVASYTIESA